DDHQTFSIPSGNRDSVFAAVSGLRAVSVAAADVIGLVDRDYYPDDILDAATRGVVVLPVNEVESLLCDKELVFAVAEHLFKHPDVVWNQFIASVRTTFSGQELSNVVANRVRCRIGDLLDGAFKGSQIVADQKATGRNHSTALAAVDLPN